MNRYFAAGVVLLGACTWSNSLYQARMLSKNAARAEREGQPGVAQLYWGQVIDKAESAYVRSPQGKHSAEALWLSGHAAARTRDCRRAVPALQGALAASTRSTWELELLLELAQCEEALGASSAASTYASLLERSTDPGVRRTVRMRQGHAQVLQEDWNAAIATLAGEDSLPARLDRATAYASLGRPADALAELAPALAAADTSVRWQDYLATFAVRNSAATDSLLERVLAFPAWTPARRAALVIGAARSAIVFDLDAADRRLQRLNAGSPGALNEGRLLQLQLALMRPVSPAQLLVPLDSLSRIDVTDAGIAGRRLQELERHARVLLAVNDSTTAGAPQGDLRMFALAELARDSIGAPRLGNWFFARVERDWPQSPYVARALFARSILQPDSADVLRMRAARLTTSPYVAAANGEPVGRIAVARLEDSLGAFVTRFWRSRPSTTIPSAERP